MIQVNNVKKSYAKNEVLKGITCHFEKGKVYGIAGENGAGKTTLFRCLSGIESCEGSIKTAFKTFKNHLGYLETNPIFLSRITGWEYLKLVCNARDIKIDDFIEKNFFDLPLNEYAENYSTGMKKKLAIFGILLQNNDCFILDEPYNGVDIHSNIIITEIINRLKSKGKTVLISSHIFSTLTDCCDEILLLKQGVIHKKVTAESFDSLEEEMKDFIIGGKLDNFSF